MRRSVAQIIDETVAYYGEHPTLRRSFRRGPHSDHPAYNGRKGSHCAISRCCTEVGQKHLSNHEGVGVTNRKVEAVLFAHLKPEYRDHPRMFWKELQYLHDCDHLWAVRGLSPQGKKYVEKLKALYASVPTN